MDAHVGLMLENVKHILDGTFDFAFLNTPPDIVARIIRSVNEHASEMDAYAVLHDVKKNRSV